MFWRLARSRDDILSLEKSSLRSEAEAVVALRMDKRRVAFIMGTCVTVDREEEVRAVPALRVRVTYIFHCVLGPRAPTYTIRGLPWHMKVDSWESVVRAPFEPTKLS